MSPFTFVIASALCAGSRPALGHGFQYEEVNARSSSTITYSQWDILCSFDACWLSTTNGPLILLAMGSPAAPRSSSGVCPAPLLDVAFTYGWAIAVGSFPTGPNLSCGRPFSSSATCAPVIESWAHICVLGPATRIPALGLWTLAWTECPDEYVDVLHGPRVIVCGEFLSLKGLTAQPASCRHPQHADVSLSCKPSSRCSMGAARPTDVSTWTPPSLAEVHFAVSTQLRVVVCVESLFREGLTAQPALCRHPQHADVSLSWEPSSPCSMGAARPADVSTWTSPTLPEDHFAVSSQLRVVLCVEFLSLEGLTTPQMWGLYHLIHKYAHLCLYSVQYFSTSTSFWALFNGSISSSRPYHSNDTSGSTYSPVCEPFLCFHCNYPPPFLGGMSFTPRCIQLLSKYLNCSVIPAIQTLALGSTCCPAPRDVSDVSRLLSFAICAKL